MSSTGRIRKVKRPPSNDIPTDNIGNWVRIRRAKPSGGQVSGSLQIDELFVEEINKHFYRWLTFAVFDGQTKHNTASSSSSSSSPINHLKQCVMCRYIFFLSTFDGNVSIV